jgi:hypothetical protein
VVRTDIREGHHAHGGGGAINTVDMRGDASGIGDVTLLGQYRFFNNPAAATELALLFGVKAPTGSTGLTDRQGALFETEFQPGSGSWDPMLGLAASKRFGPWSLDANVLYMVTTTGAQDTSLGNRFLYNAAVSYRLFGAAPVPQVAAKPHRHNHGPGHAHHHHEEPAPASAPSGGLGVDLALELNGEWHDKQTQAGLRDPNSGGNVVYLSPGVRVSAANLSGFLSVGLPVVNEMNGLQSKSSYRVLTGASVRF